MSVDLGLGLPKHRSNAHAAQSRNPISATAPGQKHLAMHRNHPHPKRIGADQAPDPTAKPTHSALSLTQTLLNAATDPDICRAKHGTTRSPSHQGQTPHASPSRITPLASTFNHTVPTRDDAASANRDVLRAQNAPEPDSQSIKNPSRHTRRHRPQARHRSQTPNPAHGGHPASKTRSRIFSVTTAAQHTPASTPQPAHPSQHIPAKPWRRTGPPWRRTGSNRRPPACKAGALPTELRPLG